MIQQVIKEVQLHKSFFPVGKNNHWHCCLCIPVHYLAKYAQLRNECCPDNPNSNIYKCEECYIMLDPRSL